MKILTDEIIDKVVSDLRKAQELINTSAETVRDADGDMVDYIFDRLDTHANDIDDTIDDILSTFNRNSPYPV